MTQDFTAQTADNLGADKIARSSTAYALYNNGIWAGDKGANTVDTATTYDSGSGTYSKPAGYDDSDTVLIQGWGAGASAGVVRGASGSASGGEGGSYFDIAIRYADFPFSVNYSVGTPGAAKVRSTDGSTNGDAGGDTTVTINGTTYTAKGGAAGSANNTGSSTSTTTAQSNATVGSFSLSGLLPWGAGNGGPATDGSSASAGGSAIHAGAGGGGASRSSNAGAGGSSLHGGAGGAGAAGGATPQTGTAGSAPGGGGGAAAGATGATHTSGAGAAGRVRFTVLRGWRPTALSGV